MIRQLLTARQLCLVSDARYVYPITEVERRRVYSIRGMVLPSADLFCTSARLEVFPLVAHTALQPATLLASRRRRASVHGARARGSFGHPDCEVLAGGEPVLPRASKPRLTRAVATTARAGAAALCDPLRWVALHHPRRRFEAGRAVPAVCQVPGPPALCCGGAVFAVEHHSGVPGVAGVRVPCALWLRAHVRNVCACPQLVAATGVSTPVPDNSAMLPKLLALFAHLLGPVLAFEARYEGKLAT